MQNQPTLGNTGTSRVLNMDFQEESETDSGYEDDLLKTLPAQQFFFFFFSFFSFFFFSFCTIFFLSLKCKENHENTINITE